MLKEMSHSSYQERAISFIIKTPMTEGPSGSRSRKGIDRIPSFLEVTQDVMEGDVRALRNDQGLTRKFEQRMHG